MKEARNEVYDYVSSNKSHTEPISAEFSFECLWDTRHRESSECCP